VQARAGRKGAVEAVTMDLVIGTRCIHQGMKLVQNDGELAPMTHNLGRRDA
jgi:hypothetical protein